VIAVLPIIAAAALYFLVVFGVGVLLGPMRVFWLEPRIGETAATLSEAPFLLAAILIAARAIPKRLGVRADMAPLAGVGVVALLLQQLADLALGSLLRGITPAQQLTRLERPAGLIYLALVVVFALMPLAANWPRRRAGHPEP